MTLPSFSYPLATAPAAPGEVTAEDPTSLPFSTWAIDELTGDVVFPPQLVYGLEAIRLRVISRLQFIKGEWFLDTRQGLPYYEAVFRKNPDLSLVQSIFRKAINSTPGVQTVARMETTFNKETRRFSITPLEIVVTGGTVFRAQPGEFIIPLPSELSESV